MPEPAPAQAIDWRRFFGSRHESWPGRWLGRPRPWGSIAQRRLAQSDVRRLLCRVVQELGVAQSAVVTLHDIHDWPMRECADALRRPADEARRLLRAGREGVRAALEAEVDCR